MRIDDNDPRPRYTQITDHLRRSITHGDLTSGQRLPSARKLAKQYGVSLVTTQKALDALKAEGVLVGYATRGTFVATPDQDGDEQTEARAHSPEYETLTSQLDQIQTEFRQQMSELDQRLTQLEDDIHRTAQPPPPKR